VTVRVLQSLAREQAWCGLGGGAGTMQPRHLVAGGPHIAPRALESEHRIGRRRRGSVAFTMRRGGALRCGERREAPLAR
jgi:hypothetical protein